MNILLTNGLYGGYYNINITPVYFGVIDDFGNLIEYDLNMYRQLSYFIRN